MNGKPLDAIFVCCGGGGMLAEPLPLTSRPLPLTSLAPTPNQPDPYS